MGTEMAVGVCDADCRDTRSAKFAVGRGIKSVSNSDMFVSVAYVLYVLAPALKQEFWLRAALLVNSLGFAIWGLWIGSWPVVVANTLFCLISLRQLRRAYLERQPVHLSVDAATAGALVFPSMADRDLDQLWNEGYEITTESMQIATRGELLDNLYLLLDGEVKVELSTGEVIIRPAPAVIGEVSAIALDGTRAGATATVTAIDARLKVWDRATIVALQHDRPTMSAPFLRGLSAQMATRLMM